MKIKRTEFLGSFVSETQFPPADLPEIALAGRSNVGKSSLLNMLLNRKNFARTSSTPGKTQTLNFYEINRQFRFVDLPGYGYAKVSKEKQASWATYIESYLTGRENLLEILLLLDIRREPNEDDLRMYRFIREMGYDGTLVITKADKLTQRELALQTNKIVSFLQADPHRVFVTSASNQKGKYQFWDFLNKLFADHELDIWIERQQR